MSTQEHPLTRPSSSGPTMDGVEPAVVPARAPWSGLRVRWSRPQRVLPRDLSAYLAPALVLALAALAAHWVFTRALGAPLWIDEGISIGIAKHSVTAIPGLLRQDGSPPVYYILLHFWMSAFGDSSRSTHSLSALFAVLSVPACAWAAWPFGQRAGVIAAALAAFSPFVAEYADETRMYSLLFLLAALATGAFVRAFAVRRSRTWSAGFGVLTALLCLTHGWGLFFGASAGVAVLVALALGPERRALAIDTAIAGVVGAVLFVAWVPTLLFQAKHTGAPWSHRPGPTSLTRAGSRMLSGRTPEAILLVVGLGGWLATARRHAAERRDLVSLGLVVFIALGTLLLGYAASRYAQPAWALRYLAVPLAPAVIAISGGLDRAGMAGVLAAAAVCLLFWAGKPSPTSLSHKSNVNEMAATLRSEVPNGTLVVSPQPEQVPVIDYYLRRKLWYVTPLGVQRDHGVVNSIDALKRLRHSRLQSTLEAAVRGVRPGGRVLLVAPRFGSPDSPWTKGIARKEHVWRRWLTRNPDFVVVGTYTPGRYGSRATVAGLLLQRTVHPHRGAARTRAAFQLAPRRLRSTLLGVFSGLARHPAHRSKA